MLLIKYLDISCIFLVKLLVMFCILPPIELNIPLRKYLDISCIFSDKILMMFCILPLTVLIISFTYGLIDFTPKPKIKKGY